MGISIDYVKTLQALDACLIDQKNQEKKVSWGEQKRLVIYHDQKLGRQYLKYEKNENLTLGQRIQNYFYKLFNSKKFFSLQEAATAKFNKSNDEDKQQLHLDPKGIINLTTNVDDCHHNILARALGKKRLINKNTNELQLLETSLQEKQKESIRENATKFINDKQPPPKLPVQTSNLNETLTEAPPPIPPFTSPSQITPPIPPFTSTSSLLEKESSAPINFQDALQQQVKKREGKGDDQLKILENELEKKKESLKKEQAKETQKGFNVDLVDKVKQRTSEIQTENPDVTEDEWKV